MDAATHLRLSAIVQKLTTEEATWLAEYLDCRESATDDLIEVLDTAYLAEDSKPIILNTGDVVPNIPLLTEPESRLLTEYLNNVFLSAQVTAYLPVGSAEYVLTLKYPATDVDSLAKMIAATNWFVTGWRAALATKQPAADSGQDYWEYHSPNNPFSD